MTDEEFDEIFNPHEPKKTDVYDISETRPVESALHSLRQLTIVTD